MKQDTPPPSQSVPDNSQSKSRKAIQLQDTHTQNTRAGALLPPNSRESRAVLPEIAVLKLMHARSHVIYPRPAVG
jgi:hypothetical protein